MRLLVLIGLCMVLGFGLGVYYQESRGGPVDGEEEGSAIHSQAGMTADMSLFLSTSGILCEAVQDRPRDMEIERIGNQARDRKFSQENRLLTALRGDEEQMNAIGATIEELNSGLRQRISGMVSLRGEGGSISRIEAIDFVIGNLTQIKDAEVRFRSQLTAEQLERLGDDSVNPFAYLDEDVVLLFHSLTSASHMP